MATILWLLLLPHPLTNRPVSQSCVEGTCLQSNLVPRSSLRQGEDGKEKTPASADHVVFKHPEKLSVIIACFISCEENSNPVSGQGIFPQVTVLTATVPPYWVCDQPMSGSFPARPPLGRENPRNEVACKEARVSFAGGPKYFENMADSISEFDFCVSHDQR